METLPIKIGDLVAAKSKYMPGNFWEFGRVSHIYEIQGGGFGFSLAWIESGFEFVHQPIEFISEFKIFNSVTELNEWVLEEAQSHYK